MKQRFFILLLILSIGNVNAQNCRYIQNKVSGMDDTRLVITEPLDFSSQAKNEGLKIWATVYGDTAVVLAFVVTTNNSLSVSKGDSIILTRTDNLKIYLSAHQDAATLGNETKTLTVLTILDMENLRRSELQPVSEISILTLRDKLSYTAENRKQAAAIVNLINCVKTYLTRD